MVPDLRVCFVGDSFVAGVGDPEHLGWVGRIAARTHRAGQPLTTYNLGIRRNTSDDVIARWRVECAQRLPADCTGMIVASFGVNDTMLEHGQLRVAFDRSASNLAGPSDTSAARGLARHGRRACPGCG
jgi:lysophospholipase L1-like esterase